MKKSGIVAFILFVGIILIYLAFNLVKFTNITCYFPEGKESESRIYKLSSGIEAIKIDDDVLYLDRSSGIMGYSPLKVIDLAGGYGYLRGKVARPPKILLYQIRVIIKDTCVTVLNEGKFIKEFSADGSEILDPSIPIKIVFWETGHPEN